jgi:hypothetical protein
MPAKRHLWQIWGLGRSGTVKSVKPIKRYFMSGRDSCKKGSNLECQADSSVNATQGCVAGELSQMIDLGRSGTENRLKAPYHLDHAISSILPSGQHQI